MSRVGAAHEHLDEATANVSGAGQDESAQGSWSGIAKGCLHGLEKTEHAVAATEGLRAPAAAQGIGEAGRWRRSTMETRQRNTSDSESQ